ncbi:MAG: hypothetical protein ACK5NC_08620 [Vibrio sp.]
MSIMKKLKQQDYWRIGLIPSSAKDIIKSDLSKFEIKWFSFTEKDFEADPFIFEIKGKQYIAYEIFDYDHGNGKIACADLDGNHHDFFNDINKITGHKSYPFVFENDGDIFAVAETGDLNEVTLYKFNGEQFEKAKVLLTGEKFVDTTIKKFNNTFYLFTSTIDGPFKQQLFYSDSLFGDFTKHPASPIANSIKCGRNGGSIIEDESYLYRIGQNCERTYGGSLTIMKITTLTKDAYKEEWFKEIMPVAPFSDGIHTLSSWGDTTVIDSKNILTRNLNIYRKIKYLLMVKLGIEKAFKLNV